jgi:hypothetical protein
MTDDQAWRVQDATGPLGVFSGERLVALVPEEYLPAAGYDFRDNLADEHGVSHSTYEVLGICPQHPASSAVDCLDCWPLD